MFDSGRCDWLVLLLVPPTPNGKPHEFSSDGVVNGIERNGEVLILPSPIALSLPKKPGNFERNVNGKINFVSPKGNFLWENGVF